MVDPILVYPQFDWKWMVKSIRQLGSGQHLWKVPALGIPYGVNGGSGWERLGYPYSQQKIGALIFEFRIELPNHMIELYGGFYMF
jgi:hypothetical protein